MNYEEFKEKFINEVKERLYEQGSDMNVSVNDVKKLNESYEAMTVTPEGARVGVNIGIERFYDAYNEGRPFDEVVDQAIETVDRGIGHEAERAMDHGEKPSVLADLAAKKEEVAKIPKKDTIEKGAKAIEDASL